MAIALCTCLSPATSLAQEAQSTAGRPRVTLDRLALPEVPDADHYRRALQGFLKREARRVDWGTGRGSTIELRFEVTQLKLERKDSVLRVTCSAVGRLPGNRTARSHLEFGGDPKRPRELVEQVLRIVARGVVTRLAELERQRRGLR